MSPSGLTPPGHPPAAAGLSSFFYPPTHPVRSCKGVDASIQRGAGVRISGGLGRRASWSSARPAPFLCPAPPGRQRKAAVQVPIGPPAETRIGIDLALGNRPKLSAGVVPHGFCPPPDPAGPAGGLFRPLPCRDDFARPRVPEEIHPAEPPLLHRGRAGG